MPRRSLDVVWVSFVEGLLSGSMNGWKGVDSGLFATPTNLQSRVLSLN